MVSRFFRNDLRRFYVSAAFFFRGDCRLNFFARGELKEKCISSRVRILGPFHERDDCYLTEKAIMI